MPPVEEPEAEERITLPSLDPTAAITNPSQPPRFAARLVSIGYKLGAAVVLVVTLAVAIAFVHLTARERDALLDAKQKAAEMVADLFAASLSAPLDFGDEDAVGSEIRNLRQNPEVTAAVVWQAGTPKQFAQAGQAVPESRLELGTRVLPDRVRVTRSVLAGGDKLVGSAVVEFSLARENAAYIASRNHILWLCMAVALGTMGVLLVVTRHQVVAPIDKLLQAVRRLERGERGVRVGFQQRDEIGRLASAFEAMDAAIVDREQRLADAHRSLRELFDHMRQAILVFDQDGRVLDAQSRQASEIFGRDQLEGARLRELLYPNAGAWDAERRALDTWMSLAFEATSEDWQNIAGLAPTSVRLRFGYNEHLLVLEFRPIFGRGRLQRVMLLCTDETEKSRLEQEVALQGERHACQMAAMRRLLAGGGQQFVRFLERTRGRLARALELTRERSSFSVEELDECCADVHVLGEEARILGLDELAVCAERLDELLSDRRSEAFAADSARIELDGERIASELEVAGALIDEAEQLFIEASPIGRAVLEQVTVRRPDLARLRELTLRQGGEIAALTERLSAQSLGELLTSLPERAPGWAEQLNKRARVEIEGPDVLVPERLARLLGGVLTQLVKHVIALGIETPDVRLRAGKPAVGVVRIGATADIGGALAPTIFVEDDGSPAGLGSELTGIARDLATAGFTLRVDPHPGGGSRFSIAPKATAPTT